MAGDGDEAGRLVSLSDSQGQGSGLRFSLSPARTKPPGACSHGWIEAGSKTHFAGFMPILSKTGQLMGGLVASVGSAEVLLAARNQALWMLTQLMLVTLAPRRWWSRSPCAARSGRSRP